MKNINKGCRYPVLAEYDAGMLTTRQVLLDMYLCFWVIRTHTHSECSMPSMFLLCSPTQRIKISLCWSFKLFSVEMQCYRNVRMLCNNRLRVTCRHTKSQFLF
jgi:hypothetical protein